MYVVDAGVQYNLIMALAETETEVLTCHVHFNQNQ